MSNRRTSEEMFPLIAEWESSNENQIQFCQSKGINPSVFSYWRKKYLEEQSVDTTCFTEIAPPELQDKIEVCYPNGVHIKLPTSSSSLATLQALIQLG